MAGERSSHRLRADTASITREYCETCLSKVWLAVTAKAGAGRKYRDNTRAGVAPGQRRRHQITLGGVIVSDIFVLWIILAVTLWLHIASNWGYWPMRKCPSGKQHRVVIGTVKDCLGREWCWHKDCIREAFNKPLKEREEQR